MKSDFLIIRQQIFEQLYQHLHAHYGVEVPTEKIIKRNLSLNELARLLSFKSDPQLDSYTRVLTQIDSGTYGICLSCKTRIRMARLQKDPLVMVCTTCERMLRHPHEEGKLRPPVADQTEDDTFLML